MAPNMLVLVTVALQLGSAVAEAEQGDCAASEPSDSCMTAKFAADIPEREVVEMRSSLLQTKFQQDRAVQEEFGNDGSCMSIIVLAQMARRIYDLNGLDWVQEQTGCDETNKGKGSYRGCQTVTKSGYTCQPWSSDEHHKRADKYKARYETGENGLGNHNYCRDGAGSGNIWCYTTSSEKRWEHCSPCDETNDGEGSYRGCQTVTKSGYTCQPWSSDEHHKRADKYKAKYETRENGLGNHSYCRDGAGSGNIWCYTTSSEKRWEHCVPLRPETHKFKQLDEAGFTWKDCHNDDNQFLVESIPAHCVAVREEPQKQAVLVLKGTNPKSAGDLKKDAKSIIGGMVPRKAKEFYANIIEKYQKLGYAVLVTGHSLGGYMAEVVATHHNLPGIGFMAPGPDSKRTTHTGDEINQKFLVVNSWNDYIGNTFHPFFFHAVDPMYFRTDAGRLGGHSLDNLIPKFQSVFGDDVMRPTNCNAKDKYVKNSRGVTDTYLEIVNK